MSRQKRKQIALRLPEDTVKRLDRLCRKLNRARRDVVQDLIEKASA